MTRAEGGPAPAPSDGATSPIGRGIQEPELMHISRAQVDRILDPDTGNVTIETLQRAAALVECQVRFELV
jgi:hypothetical protein